MAHVDDCRLVELRTVFDHRGSISFVESGVDFEFPIKRAYWTYDVPSRASRAGHAHLKLRQLYVAMSGSFQVHLDDGEHQRVVTLSHPNEGLLMVPARFAQALAPWLFGLLIDRWGAGALGFSAALGLAAFVVLLLLPRPTAEQPVAARSSSPLSSRP